MPHVTMQYTKNVKTPNVNSFFKNVHDILVSTLPTNIVSCKSRSVQLEDYLVASGLPESAFVHLEVAVLAGRSEEVLNKVAKLIFTELNDYVIRNNTSIKIDTSVEIRNLDYYVK